MRQKDALQFVRLAAHAATCVLFGIMLLLSFNKNANAQSVWAEGGTSTMFRASGFQVNYHWAPVQGWASASWSDGFHVGGYLQTQIKGYNVGAGDWYQPLHSTRMSSINQGISRDAVLRFNMRELHATSCSSQALLRAKNQHVLSYV